VYSLFEERHKWVTRVVVAALIPLGAFFWYGWLVWALLLFIFARRHPPIYDLSDIGAVRWRLGVVALALLLICFTVAPVNQ
jgi:hypothetical protein